ncbi:uncharacterized protein LOC142336272 [Convolutriloba macropyga]|uniref:uncharacterized protein LOC142336272 n=1 Tax=Convolutriloba macropyga TaxID=536237 RepID=UPI003F51C854
MKSHLTNYSNHQSLRLSKNSSNYSEKLFQSSASNESPYDELRINHNLDSINRAPIINKDHLTLFGYDDNTTPQGLHCLTTKPVHCGTMSNFGSHGDLGKKKRLSFCGADDYKRKPTTSVSVTSSPSIGKSSRFTIMKSSNNNNDSKTSYNSNDKGHHRSHHVTCNNNSSTCYNSNPIFANFVELTCEENEEGQFDDDTQSEINSVHFLNDTLLRAGSRSSISTFKPNTSPANESANERTLDSTQLATLDQNSAQQEPTNMHTSEPIQNYQKPKFSVLKRIDKPHSSQRNSIAGPSATCPKTLLEMTSQIDEDLKLDFKPLAISPQLLTFGNTLNHRRTNSINSSDLDISGMLRPKTGTEPRPPCRRNSRLSTEKIVKRGDFGLVLQFEGLKQLSSYGLTYASQLLSIVVRSSSSKSVLRSGLLHADLSTESKTVQDFVHAVTGETIRNLITNITLKKQCEKAEESKMRNKASSAPSLALVSSTLTTMGSEITTSEPDSSKTQESTVQDNGNSSSAHLYKHRASTDSTDSGVGSQLDQSEEQIESPTSSTSSRSTASSTRTSPDSHYQNREFIQLMRFEKHKKSCLSHSKEASNCTITNKQTTPTKEVNNNNASVINQNLSMDPLSPDLDFEFTLFHVGFDVLPCFMALKGLNVDIHHFTMKSGKTAFLRICTETGTSNTGLLPSLTIPRSTFV